MDVVAFIGPAGSGKSHRASFIAYNYNCDMVIDDGLVISDGKILAGSSAKREETKMAAVKRAIFNEPAHREEVRSAIWKAKPNRILILGTSVDMIVRITDALDLPRPELVVNIEDVATPAQIRLARRKRRQEGKHVIPAPTLEVKRSMSGYLVDPLRFLLKRHDDDDPLAVEKSVVRPTFSSLGKFFIADTVVSSIAVHAAEQIPGLARVEKAVVESTREGVTVDLDVILRYGYNVWEVLGAAQTVVRDQVAHMTALNVLAINLLAKRLTLS